MFLFGLEGSGFIIAVALTLLVSGAIMFYCLKRFSVVETAITEQGKILQSFIQNSQSNSITGGLASSVALDSAREQCELPTMNLDSENDTKTLDLTNNLLSQEKIEVSDDDNSEDDSEDSDDDSDDDSIENINFEDKEKEVNIENDELIEPLTVQDIVISKIAEDADVKLISTQVFQVDGLATFDLKDSNLNLENATNLDSIQDITDSNEEIKFDKLKVGDLRNLVVEKKLVDDPSKAAKMKKEELLKLLN